MKSHAILIPAFNAAATLEETLSSLLQQEWSALAAMSKVVVADDGSKNDTISLAKRVLGSAQPTPRGLAEREEHERTRYRVLPLRTAEGRGHGVVMTSRL
jgi:glycosyltransferase involved in cell wall biosynthesis